MVENDQLIRDVIKRGLEKEHQYSVETAADGRTGLRMALEND